MILDNPFPEHPYIGKLHTTNGRTWRWDGVVWRRIMDDCLGGGWGDLTYTNPNPVPRTIGGINAGETFFEVPLSKEGVLDMWTKLLYPYMNPQITMFQIYGQSTSLGYGECIPEDVMFIWNTSYPENIKPNTIKIIDITYNILIVENYTNNVPREYNTTHLPICKALGETHSFRIEAETTRGDIISRVFTVRWDVPIANPSFVYFRINGENVITLNEIYPSPANPTFTWQIANIQYVDFNRPITITDLHSGITFYSVPAILEQNAYTYLSSLPGFNGSAGDERVFRITGYNVLGNSFSRTCKIVWVADDYIPPVITQFKTVDTIYLESGDTLVAPTNFTWTINDVSKIKLNTIKIIDITTNNTLVYQDISDGHHTGGVNTSTQLVSHIDITHLTPTDHYFRIQVEDIRGNIIHRNMYIRWHDETIIPPTPRVLTLTANPSNFTTLGFLQGAGTYIPGEQVIIRSNHTEKYTFVNWTIIIGNISFVDYAVPEVMFNMPDEDLTIRANYIPPRSVTLQLRPPGLPSGTATLVGAGLYKVGEIVTVSIIDINPQYIFTIWEEMEVLIPGIDLTMPSITFEMPDGNVLMRAWLQLPNSVTLTSNYPGIGTLHGAGQYPQGANVTIDITGLNNYLSPNGQPMYAFLHWENTTSNIGWTNDINGSTNPSFTMPNGSVAIKAILIGPNTVTTQSNLGNPTITGAGQYIPGGLVTIEINPATFGGNAFTGFTVEAGTPLSLTIVSDYIVTFVMPDRNVTIQANFDPPPPPPPDYVYHGATNSNNPAQDIENTFPSSIGKISNYTTSWNFLDYLIFACPTNIHNANLLAYQPQGGLVANMEKKGTQTIHGKTYNIYFSGAMIGSLSNATVYLLYQ